MNNKMIDLATTVAQAWASANKDRLTEYCRYYKSRIEMKTYGGNTIVVFAISGRLRIAGETWTLHDRGLGISADLSSLSPGEAGPALRCVKHLSQLVGSWSAIVCALPCGTKSVSKGRMGVFVAGRLLKIY